MSSRLDKSLLQAKQLEAETWTDFWSVVVECSDLMKAFHPNKRRPWLSHVIEELYKEQGGLCAIGGEALALSECTVDHRIPFCYGGGNERKNLQLACLSHNQQKGRMGVDPLDLLKYLEDKYMNR
jgi:hypothetical protein